MKTIYKIIEVSEENKKPYYRIDKQFFLFWLIPTSLFFTLSEEVGYGINPDTEESVIEELQFDTYIDAYQYLEELRKNKSTKPRESLKGILKI